VAQSDPGDGKRPLSPYRFLSLGFEITVPVVLFMFVGYKVDGWLDCQPWFLLGGALTGIGVGFYSMFRRLMPADGDGDGANR
jgi:F0F1-type ATP synthase assembly protein I